MNKCNCIIGKQSSYDETWEIKKDDFSKNDYGFISTNYDLTFHNYCYKCGKKIDKEKYINLYKKIIVEEVEE